jgi:PAS domain S-box-containing protein
MASYRIALIEDEAPGVLPVTESAASLNYNLVRVFYKTEDALLALQDLAVDVVLVDIKMRRSAIDGIVAAGFIRKLYNLPVVFLTAYPGEKEKSKGAGAFGYLLKPLTEPAQLQLAVETAMYSHDVAERTARTLRFAVDPQGRLLSVNALSEQWLGYAPRDLRGRTFNELVDPAQRAKLDEMHQSCFARGETFTEVVPLRSRLGASVEIGMHAEPIVHHDHVFGVFYTAYKVQAFKLIDWRDPNSRRRQLIRRKIAGTATGEELGELQYLQRAAEAYLSTLEPFDPAQLDKLRELAKSLGVRL